MKDEVIELTIENFDNETKKGNWVIDFWAAWCGPCRILSPTVEALASELKGKINFGKVDVDAQQELAERFEVMSIPTLLYMKDGQQVDRTVGAIPKAEIQKKIKEGF